MRCLFVRIMEINRMKKYVSMRNILRIATWHTDYAYNISNVHVRVVAGCPRNEVLHNNHD